MMIKGKKNRYYKENKFAELVALVGTYIRYTRISSSTEKFEEYYNDNIRNINFYYQSQRIVNKIVRDEVLKTKCKYGAYRMKRFYRFNIQRKPKIEKELYDYVKFVMDYILKNKVLLEIAIYKIMIPCSNYTEQSTLCNSDCWQFILQWQYDRLSQISYNITSSNLGKKQKAVQLLNRIEEYSLEEFKSVCREKQRENNICPIE